MRLFRWEVGGYDDAAQIGQYVRIEVQGLGSKLPPAGTAGTKSNRIKGAKLPPAGIAGTNSNRIKEPNE